jgi:hypothetical protein
LVGAVQWEKEARCGGFVCIFPSFAKTAQYEFDFETLRVVIVPQFELLVSSFQKVAMIDSIKDIWFVLLSEGLIRSFSLFRLCRRTCFRTQGLIFWQLLKASSTLCSLYENREDEHENGEAEPLASPWCVLFYCRPVSGPKNKKNMRDDVMPCS